MGKPKRRKDKIDTATNELIARVASGAQKIESLSMKELSLVAEAPTASPAIAGKARKALRQSKKKTLLETGARYASKLTPQTP